MSFGDGSRYYAEGIKNDNSVAKQFRFTFDPKWKVVSHASNTFSFVLQPNEEAYYVAKFVDPDTQWTFWLTSRSVVDV